MSTYSTKVIKSGTVKIVERAGREAPGFQKVNFHDTGTNAPSDREYTSEIERLRREFAEEMRQKEARAYEQGVLAGRTQNEDRYSLEMKKRVDNLDKVIRELALLKQRLLQEAEEEMVRLSLHVAEKIIHHEIATNREVILHVLKEAMKSVLDRDNITIRLHPDDYQQIMEIRSEFLANFDGLKNVIFQQDEGIKKGGAVIETPHGEVDARIEQQFREVKQALLTGRN
ncbi:MAG TPA: FliH/SctL family protein [Syntrophales bacterium]|jgi:flagellar assembly protein FliH|nr:FliH/SctL family protein [Syntrophales bacterium]HON22743.1 FliH/SctL family protein [Syntrophales bacterium]HOU77066.1 FliH/SctL family protein [Syntrophales bacterium]HPC32921.1 FliH/SctL family protein [Syntrophales bacterium]HQG35307.1 FliH/SctL family protein [Syntrophales bacterium]